ncbi:hypothetical protein NEFER03_0849 [Nematocida sp. LUAm3]|nr:hypothetical protein NEFER03_0849 [Nematocida sp. LUAm3]KAI5174867.1 hypothetical protein NEFER02_0967 [Nematocida sp. LUAm2]KAI5177535.1 hypothetical protein NEFER01_0785 [Nematocida sp. LUAm1]
MQVRATKKSMVLKNISKELFFAKQALLLRPLSKPGEAQKFTTYGIISNVLYFTFVMIFISSIHIMVILNKEKEFHFYFGFNLLIFCFWIMVLLSTVIYEYMLGFPFRKSIYVIFYSITTGLPILWLGRIIGIFYEGVGEWDSLVFWGIRIFAAFFGTCFIYANIQERKISGAYKVISLFICMFLQLLIILSTEDKKDLLILINKF